MAAGLPRRIGRRSDMRPASFRIDLLHGRLRMHRTGDSGLELAWSRGGPGDTVPIVIVREHDDARAQDDLAGLLAADGCDAGVVVRA